MGYILSLPKLYPKDSKYSQNRKYENREMSLSTQLREADTKYKRRIGTSGVQGHLYESKLLSLILFRAQHDEKVVDFTLSTNVADMGVFDDICFKAKIRDHTQPLIAFIQAKHKQNNDKLLTFDNENDLDKYFNSYIEIKQKFNSMIEDNIFKKCKFKLTNDKTGAYKSQLLDKIKLSQSTVNKAIEISAIEILKSSEFSVPILFGNMDLKLRGNTNKIEKRLNYLASSIVDLIEKSKPATDVVLDESVSDGLLLLNGGLASAVGRLLVYDDNDTRFIKFTNNIAILKDHDRQLLENIKCNVENLDSYRFEIRDIKIPKLSFDCIDKGLVKEFLSKLVFFTYQGDHHYVEWMLKREIEDHQRRNYDIMSPYNYLVSSDAIYLKYHDRIQKWWMSKDESTPYLTKYCDAYDQAVKSILKNPQISSINIMYLKEIKSITKKVQFNEKYIEFFRDELMIGKIILTRRIKLTMVKVLQCLEFHEYTVLDINYVLRFSIDEISTLNVELRNRDEKDKLIIIYDTNRSYICNEKIKKLLEAVQMENNIIITNIDPNSEINFCWKYFSNLQNIYSNIYQFTQLTEASQTNILKDSSVVVHGNKIPLDAFVNNVSKRFIKGDILEELIQTNTYVVSELPSDSLYDKIKHLYVDRVVQRGEEVKPLHTLFDITEDVVIITADAGAGKSILLTHLLLETMKTDTNYSIVRINLSEHSALFEKSQLHGISIDPLQFIYYDIIMKSNNKLWNDKHLCSADLHSMLYINPNTCRKEFISGDDRAVFELNMLLYRYDSGRVIFLMDGFDEICPYYSHTVINLLRVINKTSQKNKIWITTRSCCTIVSELEINFGTAYKLKHLTKSQLDNYLSAFWELKFTKSKLTNDQVNRIIYLLDQTSANNVIANATLSPSIGKVKASFILFLIKICPVDGIKRWHELYSTLQFLFDHKRCDKHEASTVTTSDMHEAECILLTYLAGTYFADRILDLSANIEILSLDIDVPSLYENFIEAIIQKHFEDKLKVSVYNAVIRKEFTNTVNKVKNEVKMIAAHTIFENARNNIFDSETFQEIKILLNAIKSGDEKIGVICNVTNNVPQFIHRTFAEYLAVEHLFDLLKTMDDDERRILIDQLSGHIALLCVWINNKLSKDENEGLRCYFSDKTDILIPFPAL